MGVTIPHPQYKKGRKDMEQFEPEQLHKITRDIKHAVTTMTPREARYLVTLYYRIQESRTRAGNQLFQAEKTEEPHEALTWAFDNATLLEKNIAKALDAYSASKELGLWSRGQLGIGPVLSAGLLAHINIERAETAGSIWRYAGLDPTRTWISSEKTAEKIYDECDGDLDKMSEATQWSKEHLLALGEGRSHIIKRMRIKPWNGKLKTLCWKIGEQFVKVCNNPNAFYGKIYKERKELEHQKNDAGDYKTQALANLKRFSKNTVSHKAYAKGKLPDKHIHERSKRYAVKLFLAHYHEVGRKLAGLPIPNPYPIVHMGHVHKIDPPGFAETA